MRGRVVDLLASPPGQRDGGERARQRQLGQIRLGARGEQALVALVERVAPDLGHDRGGRAREDAREQGVVLAVEAARAPHRRPPPVPRRVLRPVGGAAHHDPQPAARPALLARAKARRRDHHRDQLRRPNAAQPGARLEQANRVRRVPIDDSLAPVLEEALQASKSVDYVFPARRGRSYADNGVRVAWDRTVEKAKITGLHVHDLRHDFATTLRRRGVGVDVIATLLGRTCLSTTQRCAHIGTDLLREAVDCLPSQTLPAASPKAPAAPAAPAEPPQGATPADGDTSVPQRPPLKLANSPSCKACAWHNRGS
jgi:hypothetical protein